MPDGEAGRGESLTQGQVSLRSPLASAVMPGALCLSSMMWLHPQGTRARENSKPDTKRTRPQTRPSV